MTQPRRPIIDVAGGGPMTFHGFRIARDGGIYATTTPAVHGRTNKNYETRVGSVAKRTPIDWSAETLSGKQALHRSQAAAANWVYREAQKNELARDRDESDRANHDLYSL